jgi:hypothetical protein
MTTRTVTGTIHRSDDTPWYGAKVLFRLVDGTSTMDTTYPEDGFQVTAVGGAFSIDLAAGLPVPWRCSLPDGDSFLFELPVGTPNPIALEVLRATYSPPDNPDIPMVIDINAKRMRSEADTGLPV